MKKIFTTALLFVSATCLFGQSIHILKDKVDVTNGIINIPVTKGDASVTELALENKTGVKVDYQVNRTILNPPMSADKCAGLYFCTGVQCYGPQKAINWTPKDAGSSIGAYATLPDPHPDTTQLPTYGISAHYDICEDACADLYVLYRVYKTAAGSKDTAYVTIKYTCTNGIDEHASNLGSLSNAYPNPACTDFSLNYQMNVSGKGQIFLYDIFGKKVMETVLPKSEGTVIINTSSLTPGVYFYTMLINGQAVSTKQLVITR